MGRRKEAEVWRCALATALLPAVAYLWCLTSSGEPVTQLTAMMLTVFGLVCAALSACMFDIARRRPADSHTWVTLVSDYIHYVVAVTIRGRAVCTEYEHSLPDCRSHQEATLSAIVDANKDTAYGHDCGIGDITSREDLVATQPLTTYEHYRPYVQRIQEGEDKVMTYVPVEFLALTSGTTGTNKVYPITQPASEKYIEMRPGTRRIHWDFYGAHGLARRFEFRLFFPPKSCPAGIPMGGVGSHLASKGTSNTTPKSYRRLRTEESIFYSQAVFALAEPELGIIEGNSSDLMLALWDFIVFHREQLCCDIEKGYMSPCGDLDGPILQDLNSRMVSNPDRAEELRTAFRGSSTGLAKRLWPRLSAVVCARTGSFAHTARILKDTYLKGVPMNYFVHGGTEGWYGEQIEEDWDSEEFTFIPNANFLEFIDVEDSQDENPRTYFMDQLEVGRCYEIVVTNFSGLYRYRVGDVIEITGYTGNTPRYTFSHRLGQVLNIVFERTPECALLAAVKDAENMLGDGVTVDNFTVTESFHVAKVTGSDYTTPCYVFFVEANKDGEEVLLSAEQQSQFEEALLRAHEAYGDFRRQGSVGPAVVIQVARGSFSELRDVITTPGTQFKMPRVLRKPEGLEYLWKKRLPLQ